MAADQPPVPINLIFDEILIRLPVKSLMRFKSVSTSWSALIRSPSFVAAYNRRNFRRSTTTSSSWPFTHLLLEAITTSQGPHHSSEHHLISVQLNQEVEPEGPTGRNNLITRAAKLQPPTSLWGFKPKRGMSSNGLICQVDQDRVYVFNPCTQEIITLPSSSSSGGYNLSSSPKQAIDHNGTYSIGYSDCASEYKVVHQCHRWLDPQLARTKTRTVVKIFTPPVGGDYSSSGGSKLNSSPKQAINHSGTYSIGYSDRTDEYKVVHLDHRLLEPQLARTETRAVVVKIFTLPVGGDSCWRHLTFSLEDVDHNLPFDPRSCRLSGTSVCLNGAIHWMDWSRKSLVAFDVAEEKFRPGKIPLAECDEDRHRLVEFQGCLALRRNMALWVLKDYEKQLWVKETIDYPDDLLETVAPDSLGTERQSTLCYYEHPLWIDTSERGNGDIRSWLSLYNPKSRKFQRANIRPDLNIHPQHGHDWRFVAPYCESIAPLKI